MKLEQQLNLFFNRLTNFINSKAEPTTPIFSLQEQYENLINHAKVISFDVFTNGLIDEIVSDELYGCGLVQGFESDEFIESWIESLIKMYSTSDK